MNRADTLQSYRCPDHDCDLEFCWEPTGDETGVYDVAYFSCPQGGEVFPAVSNGAGDHYPVDRDES